MHPQQALIDYTLHLADDSLILGHRNSEWTGHGPVLEQDIAISNIALDLIGQARNFYQYAASLINETEGAMSAGHQEGSPGGGRKGEAPGAGAIVVKVTEDSLAYLRDSWDYKNCLLVEQANGDWARTILRQFFFSAHQFTVYDQLQHSRDRQMAAICEKALKEVAYHLRWSSEWVIRLGDGTTESHTRMERALEELWNFTGELFLPSPYEQALGKDGTVVDLVSLQPRWNEKVSEVFREAGLSVPPTAWMQSGGKIGRHTEQLGYVLAEMQFLQRAYPGCEW
jgi:ring-1,2-phenylacetyl-CoA epoxidase subunit PaaC